MSIVLDTNVLASGIFWSGFPLKILEAFFARKIELIVTRDIFYEYARVLDLLGKKYKKDVSDILNALEINAKWVSPITLPQQVCEDPDDDKFIACALSASVQTIVSGDKRLLACHGYEGLCIIKPTTFVSEYL